VRCSVFGLAFLLATAGPAIASDPTLIERPVIESAFNTPQPTLKLPLPTGEVLTFQLIETELLRANTSLRIRNLSGPALENTACSANIVLTPTSLSAQIFSASGTYYLNSSPAAEGRLHLTFSSDADRSNISSRCLSDSGIAEQPLLRSQFAAQSAGYQNVRRTYRLAPAATAEFTQFHGSHDAARVEVVTALSRASGIFERELGISFQLVEGFDRMIFTDPATDPYSSNEPSQQLLDQAQAAFDSIIGSANYDVGILLTRGLYGLAYFHSVCDPARKGASCVGLPEPAGDAFHVNLVTHELGHQFGAKHTFNSPDGPCAERRDGFTSFEPGTGSTLMSYASLPCGDDSFQPRNDTYFHSESIKQILDFVNSGAASCGQTSPRDNTPPSINAGPEYTIPARTPFALTATGSDPENDTVLYCWEQRDLGPARDLDSPDDGLGPLFRSFAPTTNSTRMFPRLEKILEGTDSREERLPTVARTMRFRVTARDSHNDGVVNWSDTQLQVIDTGAAFKITTHNSPQNLTNTIRLEWNIAGTTNSRISATNVQILLSTNCGQTFDITLAADTPNDGNEQLTLPSITSTNARVKIKPTNNIFFDINDAPLTISVSTTTNSPPVPPVTLTAAHAAEGTFRISWQTLVGTNYVLQRATIIPTNTWLEVLRTNASADSVSVTFPATNSSAFYRVLNQ
jgi:hypothetical protein